jgi:hypothetical protein
MSCVINSRIPSFFTGCFPADANGGLMVDGSDISLVFNNTQTIPTGVKITWFFKLSLSMTIINEKFLLKILFY